MTYDEKNEYYHYTIEDLETGVYEYFFRVTVDGETFEVPDLKNLNEEGKSIIEYEKIDLDISTTVYPEAINYNEKAVLSIETKDEEGNEIEVSEIYVDTTEIGGKDQLYVSPELKEISLAVEESITAGEKNLPIYIVDKYGNSHNSSATLTVNTRVVNDENDFDWDEAIIYFMLTDRFNDGDESNNDPYGIGYNQDDSGAYHGGDLKGITEKLDYLDDLGINTIWISPIVENVQYDVRWNESNHITPYYAYHGYWASNFEEMNPHFGTIDDLHELIDEANERGIKIMVDVVLNHAGYGLKESDSVYDGVVDYFPTSEDRERFEGMIRENSIDGDDILGELAGLPDFKTEDSEVREQLIAWQTAWVDVLGRTEKGNTIDYFRIDTVKHVENDTWMALQNELTKVKPDFKIIGESYSASPFNQQGHLGDGMMDSILDFDFKYRALEFVNGSMSSVEDYMVSRNSLLDNTATAGQFLGSHDEPGFLTQLGDLEATDKLKVAASLQMTAKGQPVIYYGEELGLSGESNYPWYDNRYDMPWDEVEDNDVLTHYQKITNIRNDYSKVFAKGNRTTLSVSDADGYSIFERAYNGDKLVVGLNVSSNAVETTVNVNYDEGVVLVDVYNNIEYTVDNTNTITINIPSSDNGGTVVLVEKDSDDDGNDDDGNDDDGNDDDGNDDDGNDDDGNDDDGNDDDGNDDDGNDDNGNSDDGNDDEGDTSLSASTGDNFNMILYISIFAVSLVSLGLYVYYFKKRRITKNN